MNPAPDADTKTRILDAAEEAFADFGFDAASLRCIIKRANVNLAAVHYHFGSKEALVAAVFARRIGALNEQRLALLDRCEAFAPSGPIPLEAVLEAFVGPALRLTAEPGMGGKVFMRLFGRTIAEPSEPLQAMLNEQFGHTVQRFLAAFERALPGVPPSVLCWRFQFVVGAMGYVMADPQNMKALSNGQCDPGDTETAVKQLVTFLAAGLRSPWESATGKGRSTEANPRRAVRTRVGK